MIVFLIAAIAGIAIYSASSSSDVETTAKHYLPGEIKQIIHPTQDGFKVIDAGASSLKPTLKTWAANIVKSEQIPQTQGYTNKADNENINSVSERSSVSVFFESESHSLDQHQMSIMTQFVQASNKKVFYVSGFASPDGSPVFNEYIAIKRSESICSTLKNIDNSIQCIVRNSDSTNGGGKRKAIISIN